MEPSELINNLNEKKRLFTEILAISKGQLSLMENEQSNQDMAAKLLDLIGRRQQLMDQIDSLGSMGMENELHRDTIRNIIIAIQANDDKCQRAARTALNGMGDKMALTRRNKQALQAYNPINGNNEAWFFDKKR